MAAKALELLDVHAFYGKSHVLQGVDLELPRGGVVSLLGRNGAGKTSTLRAVLNLVPTKSGQVLLEGTAISRWSTDAIARRGVSYVPQEAKIFPSLTVLENLRIAWSTVARPRPLEEVLAVLPLLKEFLQRRAGALSGGQQQMVAIARSLVTDSRVLLMDEPSDGLMPKLVHELGDIIRLLRARGISILLVEQNVDLALDVSEHVYIMEKGRIRHHGDPQALRRDTALLRKYLGVG